MSLFSFITVSLNLVILQLSCIEKERLCVEVAHPNEYIYMGESFQDNS